MPKMAQTMAIFRHKWLIKWPKKIILINIQLLMSSGQFLIPIKYLEVPLSPAWFIVWQALWNRPAPLKTHSKFEISWSASWPRKTLLNLLKKNIFNLHIQIHKYNLLKYTNTFWNTPQIQFEFGRKIEKIQKNLKRCLPRREQGTVDLIKNY